MRRSFKQRSALQISGTCKYCRRPVNSSNLHEHKNCRFKSAVTVRQEDTGVSNGQATM